ncbi:hypothetical protein BpHYR1_012374 [Brachionus plicatilis]|uniref:Uncharacterized protein n=1 Tax=Brachionus plicatilis TaxID=10195 RepID=A0A3M7RU21_BRAPC|nr:hypothetical protein BpHYR1_012374 [Brachionus plicatilis]
MSLKDLIFGILVIFLLIEHLLSQIPTLRNVTVAEFDQDELFSLESFNDQREKNSLEPITLDQELMLLAQRESERLAMINRLETLSARIERKYHGFTRQIFGKIGTSYIGSKICHDNFLKENDRKIIDINNFCGNFADDFRIGMGRAITSDQRTLYAVTLFLVRSEIKNTEENVKNETSEKKTISDSNSNSPGVVSKIWTFFKGAVAKFFSSI